MSTDENIKTAQTKPDGYTLLGACGFSKGQKVQVFDGDRWRSTGDIGNNECFWVDALIRGARTTGYGELLIDVTTLDGREIDGYYREGVRHCA